MQFFLSLVGLAVVIWTLSRISSINWNENTISLWANVVFTFLIAMGTAMSAGILFKQLSETRSEQRPWLSVKAVTGTFKPGEDNKISFSIELKNIGRSPNSGMRTNIQIVQHDGWEQALDTFCDNEKRNPLSDTDKKFTVIPQDISPNEKETLARPETLENDPHLIGCVTYIWDGEVHQTGFITRLSSGNQRPVTHDVIFNIKPD